MLWRKNEKNSIFLPFPAMMSLLVLHFVKKVVCSYLGLISRLQIHKEREHDILTGLDGIIVIPRPQIK